MLLYLSPVIWVMAVERPALGGMEALFLGGTVALHLGYFVLLQAGYRHGDLSLVYPVARATGPMLSTTFAVLVLQEAVTPQRTLGAGVILGGVLMLTGGIGRARAPVASLAFGLGTGVLIGGYTVWAA